MSQYEYERTLVANILTQIADSIDGATQLHALDLKGIAHELLHTHEGSDVQMLLNAIAESGGGRLDDESLGFGSWYGEADLELTSMSGKLANVDEGDIDIAGTDETLALTIRVSSVSFTAVLDLGEFEDLRERLNEMARARALAARSSAAVRVDVAAN